MRLTLKALRANQNMTQADAAKAIGVSEFTWSNYEKGKTYPDVLVINKIEKVFHVSYSDIIFFPQNKIKS